MSQPEVGELDISLFVHQNIVWIQVSVHQLVVVDLKQRLDQLCGNEPDFLFGEHFLGLDDVTERAFGGVFHEEKQLVLGLAGFEELNDVWVGEHLQNAFLDDDLGQLIPLLIADLIEHFEHHQLVALSNQLDGAARPPLQLFDDLKPVIDLGLRFQFIVQTLDVYHFLELLGDELVEVALLLQVLLYLFPLRVFLRKITAHGTYL